LGFESDQMDIEHRGNPPEDSMDNDEIKEDLSAPTIVSNATRLPDRRLVYFVVNSSDVIV